MRKLKAGSLQLVSFVVVIIAVLLMMLLLLVHTQKLFKVQSSQQLQALSKSDMFLKTSLSSPGFLSATLEQEEGVFKSSFNTDFWGSFYRSSVSTQWRSQTYKQQALTGMRLHSEDSVALYLKDNNRPLALVGQTYIQGQVYLPNRGVKSGSIAGYSYARPQFIYGGLEPIIAFPEIKPQLESTLWEMCQQQYEESGADLLQGRISGIDYINSFEEPTKVLKSNGPLLLANQKLIGRFIIQSNGEITIDSTATLQDVIIIAPKVVVNSGFKGTVQILASERIHIEAGVELKYPSALVLCHEANADAEEHSGIVIKDEAMLTGNLVYLHNGPSNYEAQIRIANKALIRGLVYCEQNLELRGTVEGMVVTNNFIIKEQGSVYQNHLFNAKIVASDLDPHFVGLDLGLNRREVAKCLY